IHTIVRACYLAVTAGMLAYVSAYRERSRERLAKLAEWPAYAAREKDLPAFASTLAHATTVLGAPRVLAIWEESEEPFIKLATWNQGKYEQSAEPAGSLGDLVPPRLTRSTFATTNAASDLAVLPTGHARIKAPLVNLGLLARFQI